MRSAKYPIRLVVAIVGLCFVMGMRSAHADLAVIVHPKNATEAISQREVSKIFMGRAQLFPGTGKNVIVVDQPTDDATYVEFYKEIIRVRLEKLKRYRAAYLFSGRGRLPLALESGEKVKEYVSRHTEAVGYIDASLVDDSVKVVYRYPAAN